MTIERNLCHPFATVIYGAATFLLSLENRETGSNERGTFAKGSTVQEQVKD